MSSIRRTRRFLLSNQTRFSPPSIPDLAIWLDAADTSTFTLDGSNNVSQWNDKSGSGRNASQATTLNMPSYLAALQNGLAGVRFNGSNTFMNGSSFSTSTVFSLFCAVRKYGLGTGSGNLHVTLNPGGAITGPSVNANSNTNFGGIINMAAWANDSTNIANNAVLRQTLTKEAGVFTYYRTGGITFSSTNGAASGTTIAGYELGRHSINNYADVALFEAILYTRVLTTGERDAVHAYLDAKWGLP